MYKLNYICDIGLHQCQWALTYDVLELINFLTYFKD